MSEKYIYLALDKCIEIAYICITLIIKPNTMETLERKKDDFVRQLLEPTEIEYFRFYDEYCGNSVIIAFKPKNDKWDDVKSLAIETLGKCECYERCLTVSKDETIIKTWEIVNA